MAKAENDRHYCTGKGQVCTSHYSGIYKHHSSERCTLDLLLCSNAYHSQLKFNYAWLSVPTVCGKVIAFQGGRPNAFFPSVSSPKTIDDTYVDGVSVTHGTNPCQHIWTLTTRIVTITIIIVIPDFVGEDYFCDTGSAGIAVSGVFYGDNPVGWIWMWSAE